MKTLIVNLFLLVQLMVAPLTMADSEHQSWQDLSEPAQQRGHLDNGLPCSEMTAETLETIQKNAQHNLQHERLETATHNSDKQHYDFVIDHHKCDWIIRSSEPDP